MLIANPIYDRVFKRLMENVETAKFIIGTLLNETIVSVEAKPQELSHYTQDEREKKDKVPLRLMRLDFVAIIKTEDGKHKKVLIEMQKALEMVDIMRFRRYLGEQYGREDVVNGKEEALPILPIYILGDTLPEIDVACIKVKRSYYDMIKQELYEAQSYMIERVSHDTVIVQTPRIDSKQCNTKLDKLLSVFEQTNFSSDTNKKYKYYKHEIDDDDIRRIINILYYCASDQEERNQIDAEDEAWRLYFVIKKENKEKMEEKEKALEESKKALEESKKAIEESKKALEESKKAIEESKKALEEKDKALEEKDAIILREQEEKKRISDEKEKEIAELKRRLNIN